MESIGSPLPSVKDNSSSLTIPVVAGILAALAMVGVYVSVVTALQSSGHAVDLLVTDGVWVGLVALGFGTQIGLYTHLRVILRTVRATGAAVAAGVGTGTSAVGMLACCVHHLSDIAPFVALTGADGLSGGFAFLSDWKYVFIALGLLVNTIGVIITFRTVRRSRAHLRGMRVIESFATEV